MILDRPSWHEDAACRAHAIRTGQRLWWPTEFTDRTGRPVSEPAEHRRQRVRAAKAICAGCPVLARCRDELTAGVAKLANPQGWVVGGSELNRWGEPVELRRREIRLESLPRRRAS